MNKDISANWSQDDQLLLPVKDFVEHSPLLAQLKWSSVMICGMIRAGLLYGVHLSNEGGWHTTKKDLVELIMLRNERLLTKPISIEEAMDSINPVRKYVG